MKKLLLLVALALGLQAYAQEEKKEAKAKINWMSMEEAEEAAQKEPRKLLIDVYTDWCGWCKRMDQTTFQNPQIVEYVNENYYAVKLDAEQKDSIRFKDHTFKFVDQGRRGYHELAAALLNGKMSYPNIVYMDENLNLISAVPGFQNAKNFEKIINYIAEDEFKETPFEEYVKNFESQL